MNTRCHYCGWSFSLSRDALETAVSAALAANEKTHVEHCPRCRRVIKLPVEQLRRSLPAGWAPTAPVAAAPVAEPVAEAVAAAVPSLAPVETDEARPKRRRRGAPAAIKPEAAETPPAQPQPTDSKTKPPSGKTAAEPSAAKTTTRKQSKP